MNCALRCDLSLPPQGAALQSPRLAARSAQLFLFLRWREGGELTTLLAMFNISKAPKYGLNVRKTTGGVAKDELATCSLTLFSAGSVRCR